MSKVDLSIVIISYNTSKLLLECIESIYASTRNINFEIIVVDNDSKDDSVSSLKKIIRHKKGLYLIESKENLGFSKGNNRGIRQSKGDFVLLLNSDTYIEDNVLSEMVTWMKSHKKVGIATCALKNRDGSLQGSGGFFPTLPRVASWLLFLDDIPGLSRLQKPFHPVHSRFPLFKNDSLFKNSHEQDWITGAFFLVRREVLDEVGLLDEDFFMYTEELELCYRATKAGWRVWYIADWGITHYGQASSSSEFATIQEIKGVRLFYKKHFSSISQFILRILLGVGIALRVLLFGILEGKKGAYVYGKALKYI